MKIKFLIITLSFLLIFSGVASASSMGKSTDIPVFDSLEQREALGNTSDVFRIRASHNKGEISPLYEGGYFEYKYVRTVHNNNIRLGYHPSFPNWIYSDGYWFSNSKTVSMGFNIGYGPFSVGVAASSASSGFFREADGNRRSRPWVRADVATKIYDMYIYDDQGNLLTISREYYKTSTTSDVQIFIDHR